MGPDIMIPREVAEEWGCSEKRVGNMIYRCTLPSERGRHFESRDGVRVLSVVARAGRELGVTHGPQDPAQRLLGHRDAVVLEQDLGQINQPPAPPGALPATGPARPGHAVPPAARPPGAGALPLISSSGPCALNATT